MLKNYKSIIVNFRYPYDVEFWFPNWEKLHGIKTAVTIKKGFMWRCPSVTYFLDDIIKMIWLILLVG
jgi:hypothetical protein